MWFHSPQPPHWNSASTARLQAGAGFHAGKPVHLGLVDFELAFFFQAVAQTIKEELHGFFALAALERVANLVTRFFHLGWRGLLAVNHRHHGAVGARLQRPADLAGL